jgi:peptide/nickel transport system substrate-binding protein
VIRRLLFPILALAVLAACGDMAAGDPAADVAEDDRYGGSAVLGIFGDLQTMNALVSSDYNSGSIQREMLFMPLIKYDENLEPTPWLAESWDVETVEPDSIVLTFRIRDDIFWHDGEPTTAHDVAFTFERAINPETAFPNAANFDLWNPEVEVLDDHTVRFRLRQHADFLDMWYWTPPMPRHLLGDVPPSELLTHPFGTSQPVGNGPFRHLRRTPGQEWVFAANEDFTEALGGRPYLDRLVVRVIPEQTTLLTEILTGGVDIYQQPNPEQVERLEAAQGVEVLDFPFRQWTYLAWNTRRDKFSDPRVRRALTMAIDRQQIVDALLYGMGDVGRSTATPGHWSFDPDDDQTYLPYDPDAALELLAEAGWTRDGQGILRNAQGEPLSFTLITNDGNDLRVDMMQVIQAQLRRIGVQVQPRRVEWNTMIRQLQGSLNAQGVRERDFDAAIVAWIDYFRKDDTGILHSDNLDAPYQYVGYSNPEADRLMEQILLTVDREEARPLWQEYQRLIVRDSPYTVLHYPRRMAAVRTRLNDVHMDARGELVNVTEWWIAPRDRRGRGG